jgi:hypothetical protein
LFKSGIRFVQETALAHSIRRWGPFSIVRPVARHSLARMQTTGEPMKSTERTQIIPASGRVEVSSASQEPCS